MTRPSPFPRAITRRWLAAALRSAPLAALALAGAAFAQAQQPSEEERQRMSEATEVWEPEPPVVTAPAGDVPSDAIALLDGGLGQWESSGGGAAPWTLADGVMTVVPGSGDIRTRQSFCDVQLHLEWRTPTAVAGLESQARNNSGVFLQERYEIQILDSFRNRTYANGQAASLYKQAIPLVNAMRPPGEWQSYDIIFTAPRFSATGEVERPGRVTVLHNGVLVQNHVEIQGATVWIGEPAYEAHGCAPLSLQDHGDRVSFRNIWVRELSSP